ncbi:MAG: DUF58 domain-containing protein [Clostridiales bacterium]|nr:DUF58 domain-containing protein [Clostridiales bacterium]
MRIAFRQPRYGLLLIPLLGAALFIGDRTWWGLFLMALLAPATSLVFLGLGRPSFRLAAPSSSEPWERVQGEPFTATWVRGFSLFRPVVHLEHPWFPQGGRELAPFEREITLTAPPLPRGVHPLPPLIYRWSDPLGLLQGQGEAPFPQPLRVLPAPLPLRRPFVFAQPGRRRHLPLLRDPSAWSGLRLFRPGDDPRHIHWPSSLRLGKTMVRDWDEERGRRFLLLIDPRPFPSEDLFEKALRLAVTLAKEGEAQGVGLYYQEPDRPYPPERLSPLELARRLAELRSKSPSFYPGRWRPLEGDHLTLFLGAAPTPDRLALAARSGVIFIAPGHGDDEGFSLLTFPRGKRAE